MCVIMIIIMGWSVADVMMMAKKKKKKSNTFSLSDKVFEK